MIYDNIKNIDFYKGLSNDVYTGLIFLASIDSTIEIGVHQVSQNVKAIVSEYETKAINPNGFEAHRQFLDIQYLIYGEETIKCKPIDGLTVTKEYDAENDYLLMNDEVEIPANLLLGNGYFALLYPDDAHEPQLCVGEPKRVKKVVVKIKIR